MVRKYRKKPVVIEAIQFTGDNYQDIMDFVGTDGVFVDRGGQVVIETKEGKMRTKAHDYIIKGVAGEFYPCDREIFYKTYEEED